MSEEIIGNPQIDDMPHEEFHDFYRIWQNSIEGQDGSPQAQLLLPRFEKHLPFITWFDYHPKTDRFFGRYQGSGFVDATGLDASDRFADEFPNSEKSQSRFRQIVHTKQPVLTLGSELIWSQKDYKTYDSLGCPLFDEDGDVAGVLHRLWFST